MPPEIANLVRRHQPIRDGSEEVAALQRNSRRQIERRNHAHDVAHRVLLDTRLRGGLQLELWPVSVQKPRKIRGGNARDHTGETVVERREERRRASPE